LEHSFALMFNNEDPVLTVEHLLPVGKVEPWPAHECADVETVGMEDMLLFDQHDSSSRLFLQGMSSDGMMYLNLDLELDSAPLSVDEVTCSLDIDSIIWVTHHLKFNTFINIHVLPYEQRLPPIAKNNHVYVELLMPQSEADDFGNGERAEWFTVRASLSTIPHSHFAKVRNSGNAKISVTHVFSLSLTGWRRSWVIQNLCLLASNATPKSLDRSMANKCSL
jgi:hypothetical protein